jgi:hypothetical protein
VIRRLDKETTIRKATRKDSVLTTLAICGDPVVGRALTLLLRGSGYNARFLPTTSLGALKDVQLLVLTPTPELSTKRHNALLAALKEATEPVEMPVLVLVTPYEERLEEEAWDKLWYRVPWPCRTGELEWWVEAALPRHYRLSGERAVKAANTR